MELNMKDTGKKTSNMVKVWRHGQMEQNTMVIMFRGKSME
jgi:hypothetical protein